MNLTRNDPPFDPRAGVIDRPSSPASTPPPTEQLASGPYVDVLFHGLDAEQFKSQWHQIQGAFVDAPEQAVKQADELVQSVIQKLENEFASARSNLEHAWGKDTQPSTEDLRMALQRYRAFFNRLLSL